MRWRWLTDTSIPPAICLTERGEQLRVPHAWRREHCLLVRGDTKREGGREGRMKGESERLHCLNFSLMKEIVSPQDEQKSMSCWRGWLKKRTVKMYLKWSAHAIHAYSEQVIFSYWPWYSFTMECKSSVMSATAFFSGWPTYWAITTHTHTQIVCGCVCLYNICGQKLLWLKGGYRDLFGRAVEGLFFLFFGSFFFWVSLDLYFILAFPCKMLG